MHLFEKSIKKELKYSGRILDVFQDTVLLENNSKAFRDVVVHSGGVGVLPITDDNCILLVKQFRYPQRKVTLEIPAGKLEIGENHYDCGIRELAEETGYGTEDYSYFGKIFPTPAYCTEIIHIYIAKKLTLLNKQNLDNDEFIDVVKLPFNEAVNMIFNDEIEDAKTQIAILKAAVLEKRE